MFSTSLRTRFALSFGLAIMAATALLSLGIGARSSAQVRGEIGLRLGDIAFQVADKLDRGMWARSGEVTLLATIARQEGPDRIAAIQNAIDTLQGSIPIFSWIGYTDAAGTVLAGSGGILVGADISKRPVFVEGAKGFFAGDVHDAVLLAKLLPNPSGEPMKFVDISVAVRGRDGQLQGVLATHLSWAWAREIEASVLAATPDAADIEVFVVAADDTVLLGPRDAIGLRLGIDPVMRARAGKTAWSVVRWPDGRDYLTGAAFGNGHEGFAGLGWTAVARRPVESAYAPVMALQSHILWWGIGIALLAALAGWIVAGRVAAPLARIAMAADALRRGDRTAIPDHRGILDIEILTASLKALIADLTHTETARDAAQQLASQDRLTGLPNRLALDHFLAQAVAQGRRDGTALAILCLDLDGFKAVNDTLGHPAGDELLCQVADRLRHCARGGDLIARLGGDEFVMILSAPLDAAAADAMRVSGRIIEALTRPFALADGEARIGTSIGIALWPAQAETTALAMALADQALYRSKRGGKGRATIHDPLAED